MTCNINQIDMFGWECRQVEVQISVRPLWRGKIGGKKKKMTEPECDAPLKRCSSGEKKNLHD